ncbi:MAG TPA: hypothetical protein VFJ17_07205 [Mycobacteriales bacterium]|jgi:hypothetical protein|nr:hypothetical protein [Mycobacteriales bacterium]
MRIPRLVAVAIGAATLVLTAVGPASATTVDNDPANQTSCQGVFQGAGDSGTLTKTLLSVHDNGDGTWTLTFAVHSSRPTSGTDYRLRDCAFTDANNNQMYDSGESLYGTDAKAITLDSSGNTSTSITVYGTSGDTVCDRVALSGTDPTTQTSFTDKSNVLCTTLTETQVPAGTVGGLGLATAGGAALGISTLAVRRRRRRPTAEPAG